MSDTTSPPTFADPARSEDERRVAVAEMLRPHLVTFGLRADLADEYADTAAARLSLNERGELVAPTGFHYMHSLTDAAAVRELARRTATLAPEADRAAPGALPTRPAPTREQTIAAMRQRVGGMF